MKILFTISDKFLFFLLAVGVMVGAYVHDPDQGIYICAILVKVLLLYSQK
jgi:hypothetical protein